MHYETSIIPYMNESITEVLREYFDVKCCDKGHWWFTEWDSHCRKVFNVYALKGTDWPMYWGYNFDFIPWEKNLLKCSGKLGYFRTEKAVHIDYGGSIYRYIGFEDFCSGNSYNWDSDRHREFLAARDKYFVPIYGPDAEWAKEHIGEVVRQNIPFMQDWFGRIKTIDDIIALETENINENETEISFPYGSYWVRGFLYAKQHRMEEAIADIQRVYDRCNADKQIPPNVLKKLYEVDKLI